jgi:hypothetical protein
MLFELIAAAVIAVFGSCVYSMIDGFVRDLKEQ